MIPRIQFPPVTSKVIIIQTWWTYPTAQQLLCKNNTTSSNFSDAMGEVHSRNLAWQWKTSHLGWFLFLLDIHWSDIKQPTQNHKSGIWWIIKIMCVPNEKQHTVTSMRPVIRARINNKIWSTHTRIWVCLKTERPQISSFTSIILQWYTMMMFMFPMKGASPVFPRYSDTAYVGDTVIPSKSERCLT